MEILRINLKNADYRAAEAAARNAAGGSGNGLALTAWYDKKRKVEGPSEACAHEGWKCARVYADSHGASIGVSVNEGEYEFYFSRTPKGYTELDRDEALDIHRGMERRGEFDDVQGG